MKIEILFATRFVWLTSYSECVSETRGGLPIAVFIPSVSVFTPNWRGCEQLLSRGNRFLCDKAGSGLGAGVGGVQLYISDSSVMSVETAYNGSVGTEHSHPL